MIYDNMVEIDSHIYADTEYQPGDELIVYLRHRKGYIVVYDVSESTFLKLQKAPSHETITKILLTHKHS